MKRFTQILITLVVLLLVASYGVVEVVRELEVSYEKMETIF